MKKKTEYTIRGFNVIVLDAEDAPDAIFRYECEVYGDDPDVLLGYDCADSKTEVVVNALKGAEASQADITAALDTMV